MTVKQILADIEGCGLSQWFGKKGMYSVYEAGDHLYSIYISSGPRLSEGGVKEEYQNVLLSDIEKYIAENREEVGCDFCRLYDFGAAAAEIDLGKYASIYLAGGSYRFPKEKQFKYCPECGKKL